MVSMHFRILGLEKPGDQKTTKDRPQFVQFTRRATRDKQRTRARSCLEPYDSDLKMPGPRGDRRVLSACDYSAAVIVASKENRSRFSLHMSKEASARS